MAKTYTLAALGSSVGAIAAAKNMGHILNAGPNVVRVYRVWVLNNQVTAVTGVATLLSLRKITAMTTPTALTPLAHDSADATFGLTGVTAGYLGTPTFVGSPGDTFRQVYWSTDEAAGAVNTFALDNDALETIVPLNCIWDSTGDANLEPITLRANEGLAVISSAGAAGILDVMIQFTVGA